MDTLLSLIIGTNFVIVAKLSTYVVYDTFKNIQATDYHI